MPNPTVRPHHRGPLRLDLSSRHERGPALLHAIFAVIRQWIARSGERQALRDLAERDDPHLLRDVGLTREQALRDGAKWFWQR